MTESTEQVDSRRAVEELRELDELTGGPEGARRAAWTDEWAKARSWLREKLDEIDEARNLWATSTSGDAGRAVVLGGHLDSVPNGGWLDGALNVVGALEVFRSLAPVKRPVTLRLVDWADEEGVRFGRSHWYQLSEIFRQQLPNCGTLGVSNVPSRPRKGAFVSITIALLSSSWPLKEATIA